MVIIRAKTSSMPAHKKLGKMRVRFDRGAIILLAGLLLLLVAARVYPPLDTDYFYIAVLILFFVPLVLTVYLDWRARKGAAAGTLVGVTTVLFFGPLAVAAVVFVNGALDYSPVAGYQSVITARTVGRGRGGPTYSLRLRSWRPHRSSERLYVNRATFDSVASGQPVTVVVHRGRLGFAWVSGVYSRKTDPVGSRPPPGA